MSDMYKRGSGTDTTSCDSIFCHIFHYFWRGCGGKTERVGQGGKTVPAGMEQIQLLVTQFFATYFIIFEEGRVEKLFQQAWNKYHFQ